MKLELDRLANRYGELIRKPNKTQTELKEKEEVRIALEAAYSEDEKPLVDDLQRAGFNFTSVWDLVNTKSSYKAAIPILLDHLSKPYHIKNKEGIVRALAVKEARGVACRAIINEYHKSSKKDFNYRWVLGNTMSVIITADYIDDVIAIVLNESNGESRQMFISALGNTKSLRVIETLQQLRKDKDKTISKEAYKALKNIN